MADNPYASPRTESKTDVAPSAPILHPLFARAIIFVLLPCLLLGYSYYFLHDFRRGLPSWPVWFGHLNMIGAILGFAICAFGAIAEQSQVTIAGIVITLMSLAALFVYFFAL